MVIQFIRKLFNRKGIKQYDIETKILVNGTRPFILKQTVEAFTRYQAKSIALMKTREKIKITIHSTVFNHR